MDISRYLDNYLNLQYKKAGYKAFVSLCEDILDQKKIEGLNKYPKKLLAVELEKMIMMCVEQDRLQKHEPSYFDKQKLSEPLVYTNPGRVKNFIGLFIIKRDSVNTNEKLQKIENFYNNIINNPINRIITLPSGSKTDMDDMIANVARLFEIDKFQKLSLPVIKIEKKAKKAAAIGILVSAVGASIIAHGYTKKGNDTTIKEEIIQEDKSDEIEQDVVYVSEDDFVLPTAGVASAEFFIENYEEFKNDYVTKANDIEQNNDVQKVEMVQQFQGYPIDVGDAEKNKEIMEKQQFLYELCQKEGVDFNNAMTIWHVESRGQFNCNGKENSTHDYGEMQINECNIKSLNEIFEFVKGDNPDINEIRNVFKNDWQKNMIAAVYLIKEREAMYEKGDYEDVFGCYNGWIDWKSKSISQEYSRLASEIRETLYNKTPEELETLTALNEVEEINGRNL